MGGGDLNMKKSWHPLLIKNQERVWMEEMKALEEKKKLDQLRKEKEEERQLQDLQRLQEEQTGKKRTEKLEWMYATPATGTGQNSNELEDYLLGKKRVDKMLTGDEHDKVGASHKNFIAIQNANSARDIAAKIREDPLLAIKQQEQAAYQALLSNPLRLAKMQKELGVKPKKDKNEKKKEKEEKKRLKQERRLLREREKGRDSNLIGLDEDRYPSYDRHRLPRPRSSYHSSRSRSRSPLSLPSRRHDDSYHSRSYSLSPDRYRGRTRSRSSIRRDSRSDSEDRHRGASSRQNGFSEPRDYSPPTRYVVVPRKRSRSPSPRRRSPPPKRIRDDRPRSPPPRNLNGNPQDDRSARLAAMTANANSMSEERQQRLAALLEHEKAELDADEKARMKSKGMSGFISHEQKKVFGGVGGLEDRIRRGRLGLVVDAD